MKKQIKNISFIALLFAMSSFIISCQSKTDKFLDKYDKITKTLEEKVKKGEKVSSLTLLTDISADIAELGDLSKIDSIQKSMSGEQRSRYIKISARYSNALLKLQGIDMQKEMDKANEDMQKEIDKANKDINTEMETATQDLNNTTE